MALTRRTAAGLLKFRPVGPGSRVALVAPASGFDRAAFDAGVAELTRLGFDPVYDQSVFDREIIVAGTAETRAAALQQAWSRPDVAAIVAVRGGYGSVEVLPLLDADPIRRARTAFVGYSDVTSIHTYLGCQLGVASVQGPMIVGRLAVGPTAYDAATFLTSLGTEPLGELAPDGLEAVRAGDARGPLFGGTLTQLVASLGTPFAFAPPAGHVLFLDEVDERPYRIRRMLMQLRLSGVLGRAAAVVVGQLPRCDEPEGRVTSRAVLDEFFADFAGPVLRGFPSGHTVTPLMALPLGVDTRVRGGARPALVIEEAAACE